MFSFIVCTLGRRVELARLLASITSGTHTTKEILIVNQSDQDLSFCLAFRDSVTDVKLFRTEKGLSLGRNFGLAEARYPLVAFPDDDCWYGESTLRDVEHVFSTHPEFDGLSVNARAPSGKRLMRDAMSKTVVLNKMNVFNGPISFSLFLKRPFLQAWNIRFAENIGLGAPTEIQAGEESDLLLRMLEHGARILWTPEIAVFHPDLSQAIRERGLTVHERSRQLRRYAYAHGYLLRKYNFSPLFRLRAVIVPAIGAAVALLCLDKDRALVRLSRSKGVLQGLRVRLRTH